MADTTFAQAERQQICALFDELGPDAPTLCEGWTTKDLAAHLWTREADPLAAPGIVAAPLAGLTEKRMQSSLRKLGWPGLVDRLRGGPAPWSPFRLPGADATANTVEYFVHVEDVRRAQPRGAEPRELPAEHQQELWRRLTTMGKLLFRSAPVGVTVVWAGRRAVLKQAEPMVELQGEPGEVLLFGFGRKDVARVELSGPTEAVAALREANLGI